MVTKIDEDGRWQWIVMETIRCRFNAIATLVKISNIDWDATKLTLLTVLKTSVNNSTMKTVVHRGIRHVYRRQELEKNFVVL